MIPAQVIYENLLSPRKTSYRPQQRGTHFSKQLSTNPHSAEDVFAHIQDHFKSTHNSVRSAGSASS